VHLHIPPLRDRKDDIAVLARHFLSRFGQRFGLPTARLTPELLARLTDYAWPGNVREMENSLESAVALSPDGSIDLALLPGARAAEASSDAPPSTPTLAGLRERVAAYERGAIVAALESAKGNQSEAARLLDIGRATLQDKMRKYGLLRSEGEPDKA